MLHPHVRAIPCRPRSVSRSVRAREPGKPLFLFGHSMGGTIAAQWAITRPSDLRGLPGTGPFFGEKTPFADRRLAENMDLSPSAARQEDLRGLVLSGPASRIGRGLFPLLRHLAALLSLLAPRMPVVRLGSWRISRDPAVVEDFRRDPLVFHNRFPVRTGAEILAAMRFIGRNMPLLRTPLLILHGTGDCICNVEGSRQLHARAGSADKTLRLYAGLYHDLFHEPERAEVLADLLAWLDARRTA